MIGTFLVAVAALIVAILGCASAKPVSEEQHDAEDDSEVHSVIGIRHADSDQLR
jgi:hypothetical protein